MLCIIFTKKKLLAGVKEGEAQLLELNGQTHISLSSQPLHQVLNENLSTICDAYAAKMSNSDSPIPVAVAFPIDCAEEQKKKVRDTIDQYQEGKMALQHETNLIVSFLYGIEDNENLSKENYAVVEGMDDYVHLCYHLKQEEEAKDVKVHGSKALFTGESFEFFPFKDFGRASGNEKVLSELLSEFSNAGLSVDVKGQTDLALQLMNPNNRQIYTISKQTDSVNLEAEVQLGKDKYNNLFTVNRDKIKEALSANVIGEKRIAKVWLLGEFMKNEFLKSYLEKELEVPVVPVKTSSFEDEVALIISGLSARTQAVLEAEKIRAMEEEKRKKDAEKREKISAELRIKKDREILLDEIRTLCIDPTKKEEYEAKFVSRGESLGIPDLVVKWNINEALTRVELEIQKQEIGLVTDIETESISEKSEGEEITAPIEEEKNDEEVFSKKIEEEKNKDEKGETLGTTKKESFPSGNDKKESDSNNNENRHPDDASKKSEKVPFSITPLTDAKNSNPTTQSDPLKPTELVAVATLPEEKIKEETAGKQVEKDKANVAESPVAKAVNGNGSTKNNKTSNLNGKSEPSSNGKSEVKPPVADKTEQTKKEAKKSDSKKEDNKKHKDELLPSLNDLFSVKGALEDPEFTTKKVALREDQELKVIRILSVKDFDNKEKVEKFDKLYKKELAYYIEMSEISRSLEGKFYHRNYVERSTLKDYVSKIGLDKKLEVESLTSNDLKFILQVFKEVRELKVAHANLTEDTILVIAKRKWNLQKNVEIKFVGFTSEDCTNDEMIEQTHKVFSTLLGQEFYQDFRKKFDL